jgi:hypothetical protein
MNREILEKPFEAHQIKTRPGQGGRQLSYVEGHEYIRRLNDAFDGLWSFEVVSHEMTNGNVVVLGKLIAEGISKYAYGGSLIKTNKSTGEPLSLGDDFKSAATDALKKAATLFGLGLHLYGSEGRESSSPETDRPVDRSSGPSNPPSGQSTSQPLTERQLNAIMAISRSVGWSYDVLQQHTNDAYGRAPEELSRSEASDLIGQLQRIEGKSAA